MHTLSLLNRLRAVILPTLGQTLAVLFLALLLLTLAQSRTLLEHLGVTPAIINASQTEFHLRFDTILQSSAASHIALITFWSLVGLVTYLIWWGIYNVLTEVRNELTLATDYTNSTDFGKHWRSATETLALKALAGVGLAGILSSLWYGISFWLVLTSGVINHPAINTASIALAAVAGFALHLYLAFVFIQLTFTPWYRNEAFTER